MPFKELYPCPPKSMWEIYAVHLSSLSSWRTLRGIQFRLLSHSSQTLVLNALCFPDFPKKQVRYFSLARQHRLYCEPPMSAVFDLAGLGHWTNSASQAHICLFLLCFASWNCPQQCTVATTQNSLPPSLHVLLHVICTHKAWPFFWFYNINSRGGRLFTGEKVLKVGAKTGGSEQGKMARNAVGPLGDWVLNVCCGVRLRAPQGQGPLVFASLAPLAWCWANNSCSGESTECLYKGAILKSLSCWVNAVLNGKH